MRGMGLVMLVVGASALVAGEAPADEEPGGAPVAEDGAPAAQVGGAGRLRVVAAGSAPFVVDEGDAPAGLSVDVWAAVAGEVGLTYELGTAPSVAEALDRVAAGDADLAIGPISITAARREQVAFTQPYFQSSLGILAEPSRSSFERIKPFLTWAFLTGLGMLLLVLGLVGTSIWLAERRRNPSQFPPRAAAGIANGIWMALVTMTTVGYGDRVPVTGVGRILTGGWMLISIIITSSLVAFIASALTLSQLDRPAIASADELRGSRVAVVERTPGVSFASDHGGRKLEFADLDSAVEALVEGKADVVVFDRPMLRHYLSEHPAIDLEVAEAKYRPQGYGFAAAHGAPTLRAIDTALLRLQESGRLLETSERWLGP